MKLYADKNNYKIDVSLCLRWFRTHILVLLALCFPFIFVSLSSFCFCPFGKKNVIIFFVNFVFCRTQDCTLQEPGETGTVSVFPAFLKDPILLLIHRRQQLFTWTWYSLKLEYSCLLFLISRVIAATSLYILFHDLHHYQLFFTFVYGAVFRI